MLKVLRLRDWIEAERYLQDWNDLVISEVGKMSGVPSIYQTFQWNRAWWQAFGADHELLLLAVFESARPVGFAPFMISSRSLPFRSKKIRFIGSSNLASDYCACVCVPKRDDILYAIADWLKAHPHLWDEMELINILEGSPELSIFSTYPDGSFLKSELTYRCDAPTILLKSHETNAKSLSRDSLKRHFNWFNKQGSLKFGHILDTNEILSKLDHFFEQHISRRAAAGSKSQFLDQRERNFYRLLVESFTSQGWVRFFLVSFNNEAIAYHFGFEFGGKFYWYKPTFNTQYSKHSPGEVLLKLLFEYAVNENLSEFDFTAGNEAFKYRFSNHVRKLYNLRTFRNIFCFALFRLKVKSRTLARKVYRFSRSIVNL